jgi:hypothetical protein
MPVNVALFSTQQQIVLQLSPYSSYIKLSKPNHGCSEKILLTQSNAFLPQKNERKKERKKERKW